VGTVCPLQVSYFHNCFSEADDAKGRVLGVDFILDGRRLYAPRGA
jgi:hypothetical protein